MPVVTLAHDSDFAGWRNAARALALRGVPAGEVEWRVGGASTAPPEPPGEQVFHVPRAFVDLARAVICNPDPERFSLLYALLLRLRSEPSLLDNAADPLVAHLQAMAAEAGKKPEAGALSGPMAENPRATSGSNVRSAWEAVRDEAMGCTRCHLHKYGTQTVFGEGPLDAKILFVGEQPGDQEDLAGRPFVGPAGKLFDRALGDAGVDRSAAYVTNAVKHFKFERRGKRRIHQKPDGGEIDACRWWLEQERLLLRPAVTVALGATAARSLFGRVMGIGASRGRAHRLADGGEAWVTVHPSFLLRVQDNKDAEYARFVDDLRRIGERANALAG